MAIVVQVNIGRDRTLVELNVIHCSQQHESKHHLVFSKVSPRTDVGSTAKWPERSSKIPMENLGSSR